ncbi:MAG: hypothetical protein NTY90_05660 [Candidatus Micrarchaeota archaeon]|nr:hypothetical protein [Candidatus Micrarchaeota archaeon]
MESTRFLPRLFLALIIALAVLAASSAALSSMPVPAVDTEGKGIVTVISADAIKGHDGGVYVDVEPFVSVETQNSGKVAAKIAAEKAGAKLSDFLVLFRVNTTAEIVDGPSGGAALMLLAYAEFSGKKLRYDLTATGTIELDGSIGKVGGVASKRLTSHSLRWAA